MNAVRLMAILPLIVLSFGIMNILRADDRSTKCYKLDERGAEFVDASPYQLCVTSADLVKYPRSIVTVTYSKKTAEMAKPEILVKRHYAHQSSDKKAKKVAFGRKIASAPGHYERKALVVFNEADKTVELGFFKEPKRFHFKPTPSSPELAQHQKPQLGKLDRM